MSASLFHAYRITTAAVVLLATLFGVLEHEDLVLQYAADHRAPVEENVIDVASRQNTAIDCRFSPETGGVGAEGEFRWDTLDFRPLLVVSQNAGPALREYRNPRVGSKPAGMRETRVVRPDQGFRARMTELRL